MKDLKTIRGMPDLYAEEMNRISFVEDVCTEIFKSFNFQEFRTPILENSHYLKDRLAIHQILFKKKSMNLRIEKGTYCA